MAVLHHAFRCPVTPALERHISEILVAWEAGDRAGLSAMALAHYRALAERDDIHAAFHLYPEGAAPSWMQPEFIRPGLAAMAVLAPHFVAIPNLSAGRDTNHDLLERQLPLLGWSAAEIGLLVRGRSIESVLQAYGATGRRIDQGGFRHTGGWTPGRTAQALKARVTQLTVGVAAEADGAALVGWSLLKESGALADAQAMLAEVSESDWLVMAITH